MKISRLNRLVAGTLLVATCMTSPVDAEAQGADDRVAEHSRALIMGTTSEYQNAISALRNRGNPDAAAAMIFALRYSQRISIDLQAALEEITGHQASGWFDWMLWQEAHPEIKPHPSYSELKLEIFDRIDPRFRNFAPDAETLSNARIRFEEITWGGVRVDEIPALDKPKMQAAEAASYLLDDDLVFGVEINGDTRAYPLRIMGWHEMLNDVVGGVPVALAYCTLCGAGILFETEVDGRETPFVFGSSGLLYRSNKLMFDRQSNSLWNQFTGEPVIGALADSGIALKIRPIATTTWARWRAANPETQVLALETGFNRDYGSGVVYRDYFASSELMFPARSDQSRLQQKDFVFGIRDVAAAKAWPLGAFQGGAVINDRVGSLEVVVIGDAASRSVRAYERRDQEFSASATADEVIGKDGRWHVGEAELTGPQGQRLPRVPGHLAYWFAWNGYLGAESELYLAND